MVTLREVPDVPVAEFGGLESSVLVDGGDENGPIESQPFRWRGLAIVVVGELTHCTQSPTRPGEVSATWRTWDVQGNTHHAVPVELADGTLLQMLLGGRDVVAGGEIGDDLLPDPAAVEQPGLGVGEAPLQVGNDAVVGALRPEVVGVLQVDLLVRPAWSTVSRAFRALLGRMGDQPRSGAPLPLASMGWPWEVPDWRLASSCSEGKPCWGASGGVGAALETPMAPRTHASRDTDRMLTSWGAALHPTTQRGTRRPAAAGNEVRPHIFIPWPRLPPVCSPKFRARPSLAVCRGTVIRGATTAADVV